MGFQTLIASDRVSVGVGIIFVIGMLFAVVCVVALVFKVLGMILLALFGGSRPPVERRPRRRVNHRAPLSRGGSPRRCDSERCGHENVLSAVYCGRCGERL